MVIKMPRSRLRIYIDWDACFMGNDKLRPQPSVYYTGCNEIWVNPYCTFDSQKAFFIPLTHEVSHWLFWRLFSWAGKVYEIQKILDRMWWFIVKQHWRKKLHG